MNALYLHVSKYFVQNLLCTCTDCALTMAASMQLCWLDSLIGWLLPGDQFYKTVARSCVYHCKKDNFLHDISLVPRYQIFRACPAAYFSPSPQGACKKFGLGTRLACRKLVFFIHTTQLDQFLCNNNCTQSGNEASTTTPFYI